MQYTRNISANKNKISFKIAVSILLGLVIIVLGIGIGSVYVSPAKIASIFMNKIFGSVLPDNIQSVTSSIIWQIRFPRTLLAFIVGATLAVSGAVMQSILKNPLASSYTLGVSSGAALGASIIIVTGFTIPFLGFLTLPLTGLLFGVGTVVLSIQFSARMDRNMENTTIILTGMVFSLFTNALLTLILAMSREDTQRLVFWQMGSFSSKEWPVVGILAPISLALILFILKYSRELDIMSFGEEQAGAIGVEVKKVKWLLICSSAMLTGVAISFVGIIGFIDLFTPHVVRRVFGPSHKLVIPLSAIYGGSFMVISDIIARTVVSPKELPVGAVTALIGAPFFAYIFITRRKRA